MADLRYEAQEATDPRNGRSLGWYVIDTVDERLASPLWSELSARRHADALNRYVPEPDDG